MSTIVTRVGKGSPLTHVEVDANFTNLNTDKVEKTAAAITGGTIDNTTIGATTPSSVNATTITGQTARVNGTGSNLYTYSNTFTNVAWTLQNATVATTSATTDPVGGLNAFIMTSTSTAACGIAQTPTQSTTIPTTSSVYAKAGTSTWLRLFGTATSNNFAWFNLSNGTVGTVQANLTASITSVGNGWYRCSITGTGGGNCAIRLADADNNTNATSGTFFYLYNGQLENGTTPTASTITTTTAVYGTPTLSFSGVSTIGLESNGSLFVQPAGTGALQAQATTSTTAGGNARGANAVDWQMSRATASQVASGQLSFIGGGTNNTASSYNSTIAGGYQNTVSGVASFVGSGSLGSVSGSYAFVGGGQVNTAAGYMNFIGGGYTNSGTSASAVTTQSGTMNGTTAVTLSGSNASIKVGQRITGTSIANETYVAAISGTSLTLSQAASGSSTSTLSFYTPHGVVVGGGNNQATGSYSVICGGGDAGTAANRNVASGDWSFVGGGRKNTASGAGSVVSGGGTDGTNTFANTASGTLSFIGGGWNSTAGGTLSTIAGGTSNNSSGASSFIGGGDNHAASGGNSAIMGGRRGTTRSLTGYHAFPACYDPLGSTAGASQAALLVLAKQTTDATATALTCDGGAASGTNQVILPNNSAYFFRGEVISGVTGGGNTKGWTIEGVIKRGANAASTALVGTPTVTSSFADAGASTWTIAVTADTTNGGLAVTFTGQASTTIRTVAQIRTTEMTY